MLLYLLNFGKYKLKKDRLSMSVLNIVNSIWPIRSFSKSQLENVCFAKAIRFVRTTLETLLENTETLFICLYHFT